MNPFSDSDDDNDSHEKGAIFTNASNVRSRVRNAYGRFEKDIFMVGKLVRENQWNATLARSMYYQNSYMVGSAWVVEQSEPLVRLETIRGFIHNLGKKKKLQSAFSEEELKILTELGKKLDKFRKNVMDTHDFRSTPARIHAERAGNDALDIIENSETYEKILGLRADNS